MFISEHWFPLENYYISSKYYYCISKFIKRIPPFNRGEGGLMLFVRPEFINLIKRVEFKYQYHIKITLVNNLSIAAVYWPKKLSIQTFKKSLNDIGKVDILIGDINMTLNELYKNYMNILGSKLDF